MRNFITPVIAERIPDFIKADYHEFNLFLKHFYTFLEEYGNPLEVLETFYEKTEVNNNEDDFINKILSELGFDASYLPLSIPKKEVVLHLRDFYLNRGNEKSFQFLFRMLWNKDAAIDYPRKSLFVSSGSTYSGRFFIYTTATSRSTNEFQSIVGSSTNYNIQLNGISSKVQAFVESIELFLHGTEFFLKIQIDSGHKDFIIQEGIEIVDSSTGIKIIENILDVVDLVITNHRKKLFGSG